MTLCGTKSTNCLELVQLVAQLPEIVSVNYTDYPGTNAGIKQKQFGN